MYLPPRTNTDVCHMLYPKPNLLFISNILYPNGMASLTFWRRTGPSKKEPNPVEIPKHAKIGMYNVHLLVTSIYIVLMWLNCNIH